MARMRGRSSRAGAVYRLLDRDKRRAEIPVVLCIDVEPDPRVFDPRDPPSWLGFERFVARVPALRQRLATATGAPVAFTWFLRMDPQVAETWGSPTWVADAYADAFAELVESGDELGLHTHTWRWAREAGEWIADYVDSAWGEHCVMTGLDAFETTFGRACTAHRGGDRHLTGAMLACLEARGAKVDLTVEPGLPPLRAPEGQAAASGMSTDFRGVPTEPYRSSPSRFPAPDPASTADLLLVPLLSAPRRRPPFRRWPLSPELPFNDFAQRLASQLVRKPPPVLPIAARSDGALGSRWDALSKSLDHLARHRRMPFITASAALERVGGR
jgi:hypothetical protein